MMGETRHMAFRTIAAGMLLAGAFAAPAGAQVVRHQNPGTTPSLILQAVTVPPGAETLILSGQLAAPLDPAKPVTGWESFGDTKTQTVSILNKIKAILTAKGYAMPDIIKMTVFVTADPARTDGKMDFAGMNDGFKQFFNTPENPNTVTRSTVQVAGLAGPNYLVEIEVMAAKMPAK